MKFSVLFYTDCFLMLFTVFFWLSVKSLIPVCTTHLSEETNRYECGAHGKFEYCIDGFPACVIGCHCHPGYYFDTDTKICEPNTKLTEDFRRRYIAEPTKIYPTNSPALPEYFPTQTTTNALDERVDEIAKDTDDLGDWLYNQFFKTIENQVINGTKDDQPTRRAGNNIFRPGVGAKHGGGHKEDQIDEDADISEIKKKARKSFRGRGKKKKSKVHGLRRKLLRITEDDSLFDSESNSDSGEDSDSGSSGSTSSNEEGSREVTQKKDTNKDDREHGHKKVIIFNRRPRPPLPSFIFLPSMDTPYYPPIGLPPPPVLPMYPMVPVPPVAPFFPFIENKNESCASTTTTTAASKPSDATDSGPTESDPTTVVTEATAADTTEPTQEPNILRNNKHPRKSHRSRRPPPVAKSSEEKFFIRSRDLEPSNALTSKQAEQINLVHKLRERLKMKNKQAPIHEHIGDPGGDTPLLDDNHVLQNLYPYRSKHRTQKQKDERMNDVNFRYISELIHRVNFNNSKPTEVPNNTKEGLKVNQTLQKTRRNNAHHSDILNNVETTTQIYSPDREPDDAYYTKLGKQIASLVRNVNTKVDSDTATEQNSQEDTIDYLLNVNRHMPRSYWERSIRSPLTRFKNYFDRLQFDKHSSEKNLFSLENEVNTFASTARPLTLQDLENILNTLQVAEIDTKNTKKSTDQSNDSFNVNLLPNRSGKIENSFRRFDSAPDSAKYIPKTIKLSNTTNLFPKPPSNNHTHYLDHTNIDLPMIDDWIFDNQDFKPTVNSNPQISSQQVINASFEHESKIFKTKQIIKNVPMYKNINKQSEYLKFLDSMPITLTSPPKNPEPPIKNDDGHAKHYESPTIYSNQPAKYNGRRADFPEQLPSLPELPPKQPEQLAKYPESFVRGKYQPGPTIVNYKTLNFFTDSDNKHQYMFEAAYPFQIPSYKGSFSKGFETGSANPSYFHHELHHFDYFD